ncbi:MAG: helix-turn-helix transcriptional regulator [Bacteroidota bacterium]
MERTKIEDPQKEAVRLLQSTLARITEIRKSKNPKFTLKEMSEHLGVDHSSYCRIENGTQTLSLERFFEICFYLEVDPWRILALAKD